MKQCYRRQVTRAGAVVEIRETYPTRFGDELTRKNNKGATPEAMKRYNEDRAIDRLAMILNANFCQDDWWVTLTYEQELRPRSYEDACKVLSAFIRKLRFLFYEAGIELKYCKCTAFGERGAVHHHLVLPGGVNQREISKLWKEHIKASNKARPPTFVALYSTGEYSSVAAYIVRQGKGESANEKYIKKWVCSRNCTRPASEPPKTIEKIKWKEQPVAWPGYYIDTDSIRAGCNPVNGRPYLYYKMVRMPPNFTCYNDDGKRISGAAAVKWYREHNKQYIAQHWLDLNAEGEVIFRTEKGEKKNE